jgi:hypothetical protein
MHYNLLMTELMGPQDIEPKTILQETVPFGNEFARVEVNVDGLRNDLIAEAIRQGIPEETAVDFATRVKFFLCDPHAYWNELYKGESWAVKMADKLNLPGRDNFLGLVFPLADRVDCILSVGGLAKAINGHPGNERFALPANAPDEGKQAALKQLIEALWRHERQHLIQELDPNSGLSGELGKGVATGLFVARMMTTGGLVVSSSMLASGLTEQSLVPFVVANAVAAGGLTADIAFAKGPWRKHIIREREAKKKEQVGEPLNHSPFAISFES